MTFASSHACNRRTGGSNAPVHTPQPRAADARSCCAVVGRRRLLPAWHSHMQQQRRATPLRPLRAAPSPTADEAAVSYDWSWRRSSGSLLPEQPSPFDADHPLPEQASLQSISMLLQQAVDACEAAEEAQAPPADAASPPPAAAAAAAAAVLPSQAWVQALLLAAQPLLQDAGPGPACELLQLLSRLDQTPEPAWMGRMLHSLCGRAGELSTRQLAGAVWSLSNLRHTPTQAQWQALLAAGGAQLQDFFGPDLALFVCGAGSIASSSSNSFDPQGGVRATAAAAAEAELQAAGAAAPAPAAAPAAAAAATGAAGADVAAASDASDALSLPPGWGDALLGEVEYQVTQFPADLGAFDLARLASGLADLGLSPSGRLSEALLLAVYQRTRSIEEKGAVDFALAKLDAKGKRSMHFDPRWTHEELNWLPRRERDKRRILKEGWYRTQWSGWRPG